MNLIDTLDRKIRRAFSDSATQYDVLTSLHKEIGRELSKKSLDQSFERILDAGMGTGWLTNRIKFFFPDAQVVGIDFAEGMVKKAKNQEERFTTIQADARQLPFVPLSFDCVISNLAFQWVDDLEKCFKECFDALKPQGQMHFTMFGHGTMKELFESLEATGDGKRLSIRRLATLKSVDNALRTAGFKNSQLDYERIKVHFNNLFDLLKWTKSIGANTLARDVYIGKQWLTRANQYYMKTYHDRFGITATFEVLWAKAIKE